MARRDKPAPRADMTVLGNNGLTQYGGVIREEFLRDLKGRRGVEAYKEMRDNDAVIGAFLRASEMLIRGVEWWVEPDEGDPVSEEAAALVSENLFEGLGQTWPDLVSDIMSFLVFGWSYFEIIYRRVDGRVEWADFAPRSQETLSKWLFDENGKVTGMVQAAPGGKRVEIPIEKALLFRTATQKGNPEGRSVLRNAYLSWYRKKHIEQVEGIGIERDLAGFPIMYVPPAWTTSDASAAEQALYTLAKDMVRNVRRDEQEGIVLPSVFDQNGERLLKLELLSTGGRRQFDTDAIVRRYDARIAMTMLADFILLGHDKVGSFSLSSDKTDLFAMALKAFLDMIAEQFNRRAIPTLLDLNGINTRVTLRYGDIEKPDIERFGKFISDMVGVGVLVPDEEIEEHVRQIGSLPAKAHNDMMDEPDEGAETPMGDEDEND